MNLLCLGARVIGIETARELAETFRAAALTREGWHRRRPLEIEELGSHVPCTNPIGEEP